MSILQILLLCVLTTLASGELRLVHLLFRHGQRTPLRTYKHDPNVDKSHDAGQLTEVGIEQLYQLGKYTRRQYGALISQNYRRGEIYVRTTDTDRTIMSANSFMQGLYSESTERFVPVVHPVNGKLDTVLSIGNCPTQDKLRREVWQQPSFRQMEHDNRKFIVWISKRVGKKYDLSTLLELSEPLMTEYENGKLLPPFVDYDVVATMKKIRLVSYEMQTHTQELMRISGGAGPLVKDIIDRSHHQMTSVNDFKMYAYAAHDTTMIAFMRTLGIFNRINPPLSAAIFVELHEENEKFHFKILYKNDSTSDRVHLLRIPNCGAMCRFGDFVNLTKSVIADDLSFECGLIPARGSSTAAASILGAIIMGIIILLLIVIMRLRRSRYTVIHSTGSYGYEILPGSLDDESV